MQKENGWFNLDLFRIGLAVLVLSIHSVVVSGTLSFYFVQGIARWAVPLFFMLIGRNLSPEQLRQRSFVKRYARAQCDIFLPWICLISAIALLDVVNSNSLRYAAILYTQFWFVAASCFSLLYLCLLLRFLSFRAAFAVAGALHLFGIFGDAYGCLAMRVPFLSAVYGGFLSVFKTTRWGFSFGLFYICLGMALCRTPAPAGARAARRGAAFAAALLLQFLEITWLRREGAYDYNMYFSLIPISALLFDFLKVLPSGKGPLGISYKRVSVYIYITHTILVYLIAGVFDIFQIRSVFFEVLAVYLALGLVLLGGRVLRADVRLRARAAALLPAARKAAPLLALAAGAVCLAAGRFYAFRHWYHAKNVVSLGILLICFAAAALPKNRAPFRRSLLFLCCLVILLGAALLSDYLFLKHEKLCPVFVIDIVADGDTTYYGTLLYGAYRSEREDLPVRFVQRGAPDPYAAGRPDALFAEAGG